MRKTIVSLFCIVFGLSISVPVIASGNDTKINVGTVSETDYDEKNADENIGITSEEIETVETQGSKEKDNNLSDGLDHDDKETNNEEGKKNNSEENVKSNVELGIDFLAFVVSAIATFIALRALFQQEKFFNYNKLERKPNYRIRVTSKGDTLNIRIVNNGMGVIILDEVSYIINDKKKNDELEDKNNNDDKKKNDELEDKNNNDDKKKNDKLEDEEKPDEHNLSQHFKGCPCITRTEERVQGDQLAPGSSIYLYTSTFKNIDDLLDTWEVIEKITVRVRALSVYEKEEEKKEEEKKEKEESKPKLIRWIKSMIKKIKLNSRTKSKSDSDSDLDSDPYTELWPLEKEAKIFKAAWGGRELIAFKEQDKKYTYEMLRAAIAITKELAQDKTGQDSSLSEEEFAKRVISNAKDQVKATSSKV